MKRLLLLPISAALFFSGCASAPPENPWAKVTNPVPGVAHAIGKPSAGCVTGAQSLYADGPGYRVMRITRRRFYGHPELVQFLEAMGTAVEAHHFAPLLIGDVGLPRGGPLPTGHVSHQIGLDADVWYLPAPVEKLNLDEREKLDSPSMLSTDKQGLDKKKWGAQQEWVLQHAASAEEVDRIFVNPVIKRDLCIKDAGAPWLHKLRPWWGHDDHWHVRMKCPAADPACVATETIPPGTGCDSTLDWWFSEEAVKKGEENDAKYKVRELPKLPTACADVLRAKVAPTFW